MQLPVGNFKDYNHAYDDTLRDSYKTQYYDEENVYDDETVYADTKYENVAEPPKRKRKPFNRKRKTFGQVKLVYPLQTYNTKPIQVGDVTFSILSLYS